MVVKIKKLHKDSILPSYAKKGDAGMDLTAVQRTFTKDYISYKTGLAFEIPDGYVGLLFPRSSNCKKELILSNSVGVLDSGYRGEVEFRYRIVPNYNMYEENIYEIGDRVGQLLILPYPEVQFEEVNELSVTERGAGGFGSTNI